MMQEVNRLILDVESRSTLPSCWRAHQSDVEIKDRHAPEMAGKKRTLRFAKVESNQNLANQLRGNRYRKKHGEEQGGLENWSEHRCFFKGLTSFRPLFSPLSASFLSFFIFPALSLNPFFP